MEQRWTVRWFRRRALLYHLLVAVIVPGCLYAGWWQVHRAMDGNTLSYLYSAEWPAFAVLAVIGWWQLIHEAPADVDARKIERARRAATTGPFVPPPPDADSGFLHPLQPGALGELSPEGRGGPVPARRAAGAAGGGASPGGERFATGEPGSGPGVGPGGGRDGALVPAGGEPDGDATPRGAPVHALSAYNAYLARLAAANTRKSWRNPHGITATRADDEGGPAR